MFALALNTTRLFSLQLKMYEQNEWKYIYEKETSRTFDYLINWVSQMI